MRETINLFAKAIGIGHVSNVIHELFTHGTIVWHRFYIHCKHTQHTYTHSYSIIFIRTQQIASRSPNKSDVECACIREVYPCAIVCWFFFYFFSALFIVQSVFFCECSYVCCCLHVSSIHLFRTSANRIQNQSAVACFHICCISTIRFIHIVWKTIDSIMAWIQSTKIVDYYCFFDWWWCVCVRVCLLCDCIDILKCQIRSNSSGQSTKKNQLIKVINNLADYPIWLIDYGLW